MLDDEGWCMECGEFVGFGNCPDCDHDDEPSHEAGDDYRTTRMEDDA